MAIDRDRSSDWLRSSYCDTSACVEVAMGAEGIGIRDGKRPDGPVLSFSHAEWEAFVSGIRNGAFEAGR
jgi:hypothetical protein